MSSLTMFECPIVVEKGNMKSCWSCHLGLYWDAILGCANGVLKSQEICVYIYIIIYTYIPFEQQVPFYPGFAVCTGLSQFQFSVPVFLSLEVKGL